IAARRPVKNHALAADDLAVEIDLEIESAAIIGFERGKGVVIAHGDGADDLEESALRRLDFEPDLQDRFGKGPRAAVEDRAFGAIKGNERVIDPHAAQGGHDMLDRRDADTVAQIER